MYTIETLEPLNARFLGTHYMLRQSDVDMANTWVKRIESTRDPDTPVALDVLRYYNEYGDYYGHALIQKVEDGIAEICGVPYTPFVFGDDRSVGCSASGGAWAHLPMKDFTYVGQEYSRFTDWGHCGACADGAVDFEAMVNVWEYHDHEKYFGDYNTKTWRRMYVHYREEADDFGYHWFGDGHAWKTEDEYLAWLLTYKAVEFEGNWPNQTVVFYYRECTHLISVDDWDSLDLPTDTRMMNGTIMLIKYQYDDKHHIIDEYRYDNRGDLDWRTNKPYRVAANRIEALKMKNPDDQMRVLLPQTAKETSYV